MPRYIKLDDAIATLHKYFPLSFDRQDAEDDLKSIPAADVEEVKHGEWIVEDAGGGWKRAICPRCDKIFLYAKGQLQIHAMPRCPNCGAKMDGGAKA